MPQLLNFFLDVLKVNILYQHNMFMEWDYLENRIKEKLMLHDTFLMVEWCGVAGSIPDQGTEIPCAAWYGKKKLKLKLNKCIERSLGSVFWRILSLGWFLTSVMVHTIMGYTGAAWNRHFHARNKFDHQGRGLCLQPKACALRKQRMIYKQGATLAWQVKDEWGT